MSQAMHPGVKVEGKTVQFERTFDAPRDLVFKMFSNDEHLAKWWGPHPWDVNVSKMDFREGGSWLYSMKGPDGSESFGKASYQEIVPDERIVFEDSFANAEGNSNTDLPVAKCEYNFEDRGGKTHVTMTTYYTSEEAVKTLVEMGMLEGMTQALNQLEELLKDFDGAGS